MKSNIQFSNIKRIDKIIKFCYYVTIILAVGILIVSLVTPNLSANGITFEKGVNEWAYGINLPLGLKKSTFFIRSSISSNLLPLIPIEQINVPAVILIDLIGHLWLTLVLGAFGLKKLLSLTTDVLNGETPFQLKHIRSLRSFSFTVVLYSTLINTLLSILISFFTTGSTALTINFVWAGVFIGIIGYIFSDITEYGLFLQEEYDCTL